MNDTNFKTDADIISYYKSHMEGLTAKFSEWEKQKAKSDGSLYFALGNVYQFARSIHNQTEYFVRYAKWLRIPCNKRTTIFHLCTKVLFQKDRQAASKYAGIMAFAQHSGVPADPSSFADFVRHQGGIEACLQAWRKHQAEEHRGARRRKDPISNIRSNGRSHSSVQSISELGSINAEAKAFVLIVIKDEDGEYRIIPSPIYDEKLVSRAASIIGNGA